jgi:hypothetical protein
VKENDGDGWSSDNMVLWVGKRQNRDAAEWWGEWINLRWSFYSNWGWESGGPQRMDCGGGADSILQFWLERRGDQMKRCHKIKWRQWARLSLMRRKRDTAWWRWPEEMRHRGGERVDTTPVWLTRILLGHKIKRINMVDSTVTNRWRFKAMMS